MQWSSLEPSTKIILKVIAAVLIVVFLWLVRDIVVILILSMILASAMEPLVNYLHIRRVPRVVTVLGVYIFVIAIIAGVLALVVPPLLAQLKLLQFSLPGSISQLQVQFPSLSAWLGQLQSGGWITQLFGSGGESVFSRTLGVFNSLLTVITILVISFYLVAERSGMTNFIRSLVPARQEAFVSGLITKIQHRMGRWVIGQIILSFSIFALTYIGLLLLGVKYALFLALLAGVLEVVPYIGPFLSAIPAVFFAFVQNPPLALAVTVLYIIVQKTEGYVLVPKVYEKTVGTSPLAVLVGLLVGFKLAGVLGLLIAVPLVGVITLLIQELPHASETTEPEVIV